VPVNGQEGRGGRQPAVTYKHTSMTSSRAASIALGVPKMTKAPPHSHPAENERSTYRLGLV